MDIALHGQHLATNTGFHEDQKTNSDHPRCCMNLEHYASLNTSIKKSAFINNVPFKTIQLWKTQ
jgi:hypothetical protein